MARKKLAVNVAAEQFDCPTCVAKSGVPCVSGKSNRVVPTHPKRRQLVCLTTFMSMPSEVRTYSMWCSKQAGHRGRHQTLDKRLEWSPDLDDLDWAAATFLPESA